MPDQSGTPQSVAASAERLPPAIRELHRAVLRGFRDSGQVHRDDLNPTAAALGVDLDDALHQLASADLVHGCRVRRQARIRPKATAPAFSASAAGCASAALMRVM